MARNDVIAETLKIVSTSLLGLTVGCAQCHDHRYDPIPQTDYYRLRAVFEPALDVKNWREPRRRLISLLNDDEPHSRGRAEQEGPGRGSRVESQAKGVSGLGLRAGARASPGAAARGRAGSGPDLAGRSHEAQR